ncbi:hypothetical protein Dtox_4241 [Desulfofarcimen acetoxidans DSM 771]|uniref:Phage tail sheath protein n=1 Tax=Desulfofarcimen acetoxidans (strain ATCC 49208 / DSM 771 / KCTC 5769 / VKM B-1644 / 5575) TaxID=485916 RepID=C8VZG3_DESAS|nr:phage tail sheath family protein [Desulfofarcimen acetoxidans]ACV64908.1 hypothetical protein Dtox_4241 [Desulfofarcimen acetoxidans DSM 771]
MAGGAWSLTEAKVRPGFYVNFEAAALASITPGARGILAMPVKANWGPKKQVVEITSEKELIDTYGTAVAVNLTAYTCVRLALLGGCNTVLGYRLVDGSEAKGIITLKDTTVTPVDVIDLITRYESDWAFKVTVRANPVDANKQDIVLYKSTQILYTFTFTKGASGVDNAIAAINNDSGNKWIDAVKKAAGNGTLAAIVSQPLTGGSAGVATITNTHYIDALTAFEARQFNAFVLDGTTDASLQTSVKAWVERLRGEGKKTVCCMGGKAADDADIATANTRSAGFNYEGVLNVGTSANLDGTNLSSAQVACWVAGKACGQQMMESLTYADSPFDDVIPRLTNNQIISAIQSGTIVLVHDGEKVKIEKGINTLTSLRTGQNNQWKKVKAIRIMDAIDTDLQKAGRNDYIGKVINDEDGKVAVIVAIKKYFETLNKGRLIKNDFDVYVDPDLQSLAGADQFYFKWYCYIVDNMEQIFGTGIIMSN